MTLNIPCHSLLAGRGYPEKSADNFMQLPMFVTCCFSFAPFNSVFLSFFFFHFNYNESWCGPLWVDPVLALLCLLALDVCFLSQVTEVFSSYVFRQVLHCFLFPFASGTCIMQILVHLMLFHKSVQLSSFHFNLLFYRSSSVIASTLSFSFLIHSSVSFSLQQFPFSVFFISVIAFLISVLYFRFHT